MSPRFAWFVASFFVVAACLFSGKARAWGGVPQASLHSCSYGTKTAKNVSRATAAASVLPAAIPWTNISSNCRMKTDYSVGAVSASGFWIVRVETLENYAANGYNCGGPNVTAQWQQMNCTGPAMQCPDGTSAASGGGCTCDRGTRPDGTGGCTPYSCTATAGQAAGYGPYPTWERALADKWSCQAGLPGESASVQVGCRRDFRATGAKGYSGYYWSTGVESFDGSYCDDTPQSAPRPGGQAEQLPDKAPGEEAPPIPCAKGTCPGTINGIATCQPCASETARERSTDSKAATGSDSSASAAQPVTSSNAPAGSKYETVDRTCGLNGMCSTTTTYYDGQGKAIGTKTDKTTAAEAAQSGACKDNPDLAMCKQGSFGGACATGFTCSGDPVQCALAKETHTRNCQLFDTPNALSTVGEGAMNGDAVPDGHPGRAASAVSLAFSEQIDQTNPFSGSCPAPLSVSVLGHSVSLSFSAICSQIEIAGRLLVAFSLLAAVFIVFRG